MTENIVTVKLNSGLCNRLFQIACCLGYAEKYNYKPIIFTNLIANNVHTDNNRTLEILKILVPEIEFSSNNQIESNFHKIEHNGMIACKYTELPNINHNSILLHGYFQSELYFPHSTPFLSSFINNIIIPRKNNHHNNTYFLHIRMGDYINNHFHYIGYKKYIKNSITYIKMINPNAVFLMFSNEKNKSNILKELDDEIINLLKNYKFEIDINLELDPLESLINMGLCRGGICVNSTFSWFGAYISHKSNNILDEKLNNEKLNNEKLNNEKDKEIFIMPNKWFNKTIIEQDYKDIYPNWDNMIRLDV